MQSVSSKIWTRVAVSISYEDNHYTSFNGIDGKETKDDEQGLTFVRTHWQTIYAKKKRRKSTH